MSKKVDLRKCPLRLNAEVVIKKVGLMKLCKQEQYTKTVWIDRGEKLDRIKFVSYHWQSLTEKKLKKMNKQFAKLYPDNKTQVLLTDPQYDTSGIAFRVWNNVA